MAEEREEKKGLDEGTAKADAANQAVQGDKAQVFINKAAAQEPAPEKAAATASGDKPAPPAKPAAASGEKPAAPAKAAKAPAPPDPRVLAATAKAEEIKASIEAKLGAGVVEEASATKEIPILRFAREKWQEAIAFLKEAPEHAYDYIELFAGTDYKDYIEVVMYFHSTRHGSYINVKTRTPRENASLPSLTPIFAGVNWEEREVYDLLGVNFEGHPDMRRIMLDDDWKGHPLRKDYSPFENVSLKGGESS